MNLSFENEVQQEQFHLTDLSCAITNQEITSQSYYRILWVKEGEAELEVDELPLKLSGQQIVFLTPLNTLKIKTMTEHVVAFSFNKQFYCIQHNDDEVSCHGHLFFGSSEVQVIDLSEKEQSSFELLFQVMKEEFSERDQIQGEMLRMLLKRLLIKGTRLAKKVMADQSLPKDQLDLVRQFNVLVEMNFREKHYVADYADLLNKSPKTLSNVFAKYNDKSPLQVINERVVLEARRLISYTDKSAKEIAFELGYQDAAQFSKVFKKYEGMSPSNFKKNLDF